MKKRYKVSRGKSNKMFKKTVRTHPVNNRIVIKRGGYRM